jgi:hypothetical protein
MDMYGGAGTASYAAGWVSEAANVGAIGVSAAKAIGKVGANRALPRLIDAAFCFPAGTQVLTAAGCVSIETICVGDLVVACNEASGQTGEFRVVQTTCRIADAITLIGIGDETIKVTDEHPFWVFGQGWTPARKLRLGMTLMDVRGRPIPVTAISAVRAQIPVYNMEIESAHTYLVSRKCVLVHNACSANANKLSHIFGNASHNLGGLTKAFGSETAAYNAVEAAFSKVAGNYSAKQLTNGIIVSVGSQQVTVRGAIVDGVAMIGTFWVP